MFSTDIKISFVHVQNDELSRFSVLLCITVSYISVLYDFNPVNNTVASYPPQYLHVLSSFVM